MKEEITAQGPTILSAVHRCTLTNRTLKNWNLKRRQEIMHFEQINMSVLASTMCSNLNAPFAIFSQNFLMPS